MIIDADIKVTAAKKVSGNPYDDRPVRRDLARGWTLCPGDFLKNPEKLRLIGQHFSYTAKLSGYRLPEGMCICKKTPCECCEAYEADADQRGALILISAKERKPGDRTDVLFNERYHEAIGSGKRLHPTGHAALTERWTRAHANSQKPTSAQITQWKEINQLRAFLAREEGSTVQLASQPVDEEELEKGQLVLLAETLGEAARADVDFVYQLPRLDIPLRIEDLNEDRLVIDCGQHDATRIDQHLKHLRPGQRRLTKDDSGTEKQIDAARRTLKEAAQNFRLSSLVQQPTLAQRSAFRRAESLFNTDLDEGQRAAVDAALAAEDILIVQGPPGTGKTTFICEAIRQYLARDQRMRILLAAQTHQAIDNVLKRLAEADPDLAIARLGTPMVADKIDEFVRDRYWIESPEAWLPKVKLRAEAFRRMAQARISAGDAEDEAALREILRIQEEYLHSEGAQRSRDERLAAARVVAGTCSGVGGDPAVRSSQFDVGFLEEAGKATPPEALMLMLRCRKSILVGDSRQLPPHLWNPMRKALENPQTVSSKNPDLAETAAAFATMAQKMGPTPEERKRKAEETLFDYLTARLKGTPHETTLTTQYRMVPGIGDLVSRVFYPVDLRHGRPANLADRDPRVTSFAGTAQVRLIDIPGKEEQESKSKSKSKSKSNLRNEEIHHIGDELGALQAHAARIVPPGELAGLLGVSIITPYAAQMRKLREQIDRTQYPDLKIRFGIVDRFQGDEDDVVIVSFVNTTYAGFLKRPNRINVAVSRARDLLTITTALKAAQGGAIGEPLKNVANFIAERCDEGEVAYEIVRPLRKARAA